MNTELRQIINENIKANGNGEITGTVLNEVLNAMVDAMDKYTPTIMILTNQITDEQFDYMSSNLPDVNIITTEGGSPLICHFTQKDVSFNLIYTSDAIVNTQTNTIDIYLVTFQSQSFGGMHICSKIKYSTNLN